jgi:TM2 domain-containing membrane protein YozV
MIYAILLCAASAFLYFLPSIVGAARGKRNAGAIFALNLFTGWTFIGWIIALVWALTYEPKREENVEVSDRTNRAFPY